MSAPTLTFDQALAALRAEIRHYPEDLQIDASLALLHLSNVHGQAQRRQLSPQDQAQATAAFTSWLAGNPRD